MADGSSRSFKDGGDMKICGKLGFFHWNGDGVSVDHAKALFEQACDGGLNFACGNVKSTD